MRWIVHDEHGRIRRGNGEPPAEGDVYMVDEKGSAALVGGRLYIDGRLAPPGLYRLDLDDVTLPVEVPATGKQMAKRLAAERKGERGHGHGARNRAD